MSYLVKKGSLTHRELLLFTTWPRYRENTKLGTFCSCQGPGEVLGTETW